MSRPHKHRQVCCLPKSNSFGPYDSEITDTIIMTVAEYETIRLIDLEKLSQQECADQMHVARSTIQRIYASAREKIALSIVEGQRLIIRGGSYKVCSNNNPCNHDHCRRRQMCLNENRED